MDLDNIKQINQQLDIFTQTENPTVIQQVASNDVDNRNLHLYNLLQQNADKKVMVIAGASHVFCLEPTFKFI